MSLFCENLQERLEDSNQKSISTNGGSDQQRPFYDFLGVKEVGTKETALGSNRKGCEKGKDGPDLTLKLWYFIYICQQV